MRNSHMRIYVYVHAYEHKYLQALIVAQNGPVLQITQISHLRKQKILLMCIHKGY
jgi:hypothetical protein